MSTFDCYRCGASVGPEEHEAVQVDTDLMDTCVLDATDGSSVVYCDTLDLVHCQPGPREVDSQGRIAICFACHNLGMAAVARTILMKGHVPTEPV